MNDDVRMSRSRLFALIDAFEADLRSSIARYLLDHMTEEEVFSGDEIERASSRRVAEGEAEGIALVHYLDLQVAVDVLLRHKERLPHELMAELVASASEFPRLVPIRHRVMHGRPLRETDPEVSVRQLELLKSRHWPETKGVLARLKSDVAWEPFIEERNTGSERILHNLPEADYDETSFVGRKPERERLLDALCRRRTPVITLTGEGGIGKTALALDVAYQLLDSGDNPYEAILWVSLKTEQLTAYGVEELRGAIRGIDNTILTLGQGLTADFAGSVKELGDALQGIETLIIIDNLESAQGAEIVEMYDALPDSVNYLFTSRWGIGQLERTFPVPPLAEAESILLLRKFAAARSQRQLASLSAVAAANTVKELRNSPLAIRWFVLASESGRVPLETLRDQGVLLEFCVKNVVDNLSVDSRAVLTVLRSLDRAIGFDEFAVLTEMSIDALRRSTQELTRGSLVVVEAESAGAIAGRLALTATARMFLKAPEAATTFLSTVQRRERQYKASLENGLGARSVDPEVGQIRPRDANDHPATFLLELALNFARSNNASQAWAHVERARSFNPEFSEVYRVSARLRSTAGEHELALADLQTALSYATAPDSRAIINYAIADTMSRRLRDAHQALPYARSAHEQSPNPGTSFLLGRVLVWTGNYREGQEHLQDAHDGSSGRMRLYITTAIVDGWARWAEAEYRDHDQEAALQRATTGFNVARPMLDEHPRDQKLIDATAECCIHALRVLPRVPDATAKRQSSTIRSIGQHVTKHGGQISPNKMKLIRDALVNIKLRDAFGGETIRALSDARAAAISASG